MFGLLFVQMSDLNGIMDYVNSLRIHQMESVLHVGEGTSTV